MVLYPGLQPRIPILDIGSEMASRAGPRPPETATEVLRHESSFRHLEIEQYHGSGKFCPRQDGRSARIVARDCGGAGGDSSSRNPLRLNDFRDRRDSITLEAFRGFFILTSLEAPPVTDGRTLTGLKWPSSCIAYLLDW
jgi:hypothetical protein